MRWALARQATGPSSNARLTSYDPAIERLLKTPRLALQCCGNCAGLGYRFKRKSARRCDECNGTGLVDGHPSARPLRVGICGAGIGGLALALALQHRGIEAAVFERDTSFWSRNAGYGLTMQQGGKALRALGLLEAVRSAGIWTASHSSYDATNGALLGKHGASVTTMSNKRNYAIHVPRQAVRALLYSQLRPGTVRWNEAVVSASDGTIETGKAQHAEDSFDLVVGADGIRSALRRSLIANDEPLNASGIVVVLGRVKVPLDDRFAGRVFEIVDGLARIYAMPYNRDGTTMWQLSWPGTLSADKHLLKAAALSIVQPWQNTFPEIVDLVSKTADDDLTGYPIYDRDDLNSLPLKLPPHVVLLGDAAHPMCPFKAQGANQALLDAVDLAHALVNCDDVHSAIRRYHDAMIPRALNKVHASRTSARLLHSPAARTKSGEFTRAAAAARAVASGAAAVDSKHGLDFILKKEGDERIQSQL